MMVVSRWRRLVRDFQASRKTDRFAEEIRESLRSRKSTER